MEMGGGFLKADPSESDKSWEPGQKGLERSIKGQREG